MTSLAAVVPEVQEDDRRLAVLIVDDHEVVHWGYRLKLARAGWASRCLWACDTEAALAMTRRYEPQVALVDLRLGRESGAEACELIRAASPVTRVLLTSGSGRISNGAVRAIGASGFVPKEWPIADILRAVRAVGLGSTVFAPQSKTPLTTLTPRERHVLDMIAAGATNREIAADACLSPHTVKEHVSLLYRKLGVGNRAAAVKRAQHLGLVA